ncbi:hypothetical protein Q8F55_008480 [Vanrija albida]|uniref:GP-PDE domain-containing protein n=1 Tax=Vanrija albida TaxID=181172 RepID=A0ABR3PR33_9TREE
MSAYPAYDVRKIIHAARNPTHDLVMVYAHRGARALGRSTENSFASVAAAARAGYEGIEIDLRLTRDKQVVVWHDQGLGRNSDVAVPAGEKQYNPFTGEGWSPLVKDTTWAEMEKLHLRDESGFVTDERPILLGELLDFMRDEGITMLVHLDVKEAELMPYAYDVISKATNKAGVPAMEWCVWVPKGKLYPTPEVWEAQEWVQRALAAGDGMAFTLLLEEPAANTMDSVKAWAECPYLITFEIHVPTPGGDFQPELDYVLGKGFGVGSWYKGGDVARQYYGEEWAMGYDDSAFRNGIRKSGPEVKVMLYEWSGIQMHGGVLGEPPAGVVDSRTDLDTLLDTLRFTYVVADPFTDLGDRLAAIGRRNVSRMLA